MTSLIKTEDSIDQSMQNVRSSGKAAHVLNVGLPPGTLLTQTIDIVDNTSIVEVILDPPVKGVSLEVRPTVGQTPDPDEGYLVTFSAANPGQAATFLNTANTAPREFIKPADGVITRSFDGGTIDRLYLKGVGTTPLQTIDVGGVS